MSGKFALAIIHYRDTEAVRTLVAESFRWQIQPNLVIIVDNSSDLPDLDGVVVLRPNRNVGYAAAANLAAAEAKAREFDTMLLCTQDAHLMPDCSGLLVAELSRDSDVAVAAPLLTFRSAPTTVFSSGGRLTRAGAATHPDQGQELPKNALEPYEVDWVDGAIMALHIPHLETVGGFDEEFFLYVEEVDLHLRLRLRGYKVVVVPAARAMQEPGNYTTYLRYRNHTYFTLKHPEVLRRWPWKRMLVRDLARSFARGRKFGAREARRGVVDGESGNMGQP